MGLIDRFLSSVFGGGRNVLVETAEVFRENAEAGAQRDLARSDAALAQFAQEFRRHRSVFDVVVDGVNRLPRPFMAMGTIGLLISAMWSPIWFAERMQGLALVPEALWWLMGAIVSFYFGARHQLKGQDFQRELAASMGRVPRVIENVQALRRLRSEEDPATQTVEDLPVSLASVVTDGNAALAEWQKLRREAARA